MQPTFRPAQVGDAPAILSLWRVAAAEPTHTDDRSSIAKLIGHDPGAVILAEADGGLVGTVIAGWDGWRGSIYRLVVAPEMRRRGLGRQLLHAAEVRLAGVGAVRLQAIVVGSDARATGFWGASGWEQQPERLRFVKG
jgi:ribosomal protein S18 acetylase RimI-like enzyme